MPLLNLVHKIMLKDFAASLKDILPNLISSQQTAYVAQRFIGESGRLVSDILMHPRNLMWADIFLLLILRSLSIC